VGIEKSHENVLDVPVHVGETYRIKSFPCAQTRAAVANLVSAAVTSQPVIFESFFGDLIQEKNIESDG
jgi:hypothetical protein